MQTKTLLGTPHVTKRAMNVCKIHLPSVLTGCLVLSGTVSRDVRKGNHTNDENEMK